MSTCFDATSASPASAPEPVTTFTTPGGNTSCNNSHTRTTARGSCGAGFTTTVLPIASAGPILPAMFTIGKLYGVMHATTPTGWRTAIALIKPPDASAVDGISLGGNAMTFGSTAPRAYRRNRSTQVGTCIVFVTRIVA